MTTLVDPKLFGLPARTIIEKTSPDSFAIVIQRKSRIIMADGRKIAEKAALIKKREPGSTVNLKTSTPVCSKTVVFLQEIGIEIVPL